MSRSCTAPVVGSLQQANSQRGLVVFPTVVLPFKVAVVLPSTMHVIIRGVYALDAMPTAPPESACSPTQGKQGVADGAPTTELRDSPYGTEPATGPTTPDATVASTIYAPAHPETTVDMGTVVPWQAGTREGSTAITSVLQRVVEQFATLRVVHTVVGPAVVVTDTTAVFATWLDDDT